MPEERPEEEGNTPATNQSPMLRGGGPSSSSPYEYKATTTLDPEDSLALGSARDMAMLVALGDPDFYSKPSKKQNDASTTDEEDDANEDGERTPLAPSIPEPHHKDEEPTLNPPIVVVASQQSILPPPPPPSSHSTPRSPSSSRPLHHAEDDAGKIALEAEKTALERGSNIGVGGSLPGAFACRPIPAIDLSGNDPRTQPSEQQDDHEDYGYDSQADDIMDASAEAATTLEACLPADLLLDHQQPSCGGVLSAHVVDEDEDLEARLRAQFQKEAAEIVNQTRASLLKEAVKAQQVSPMEDADKRKRKTFIYFSLALLAAIALAVGLGIGLSGSRRAGDDDGLRPENNSTNSNEPSGFDHDVYITYTVSVLNGSLEEVPRQVFVPDLITSMDLLVADVLSKLLSSEDETRLLRPRLLLYSPVTISFPTYIEGGTVIVCPDTVSESDRCEAVVAEVELLSETDNTDTKDAFNIALEAAIEEGQLQEYLYSVNPESPITILHQYS